MRSTLIRTSHTLFILDFHCRSLLKTTANHREILKSVITHHCGEDIHHKFCFAYITQGQIAESMIAGKLGGNPEYF
jgi:hypothetical protein